MSLSNYKIAYNTIKTSYRYLTSRRIEPLGKISPIYFEKNVDPFVMSKVADWVRARNKMILRTVPVLEKFVYQPLINLVAQNLDDIFNILS